MGCCPEKERMRRLQDHIGQVPVRPGEDFLNSVPPAYIVALPPPQARHIVLRLVILQAAMMYTGNDSTGTGLGNLPPLASSVTGIRHNNSGKSNPICK